jgi:hypothetical protein
MAVRHPLILKVYLTSKFPGKGIIPSRARAMYLHKKGNLNV